MTDTRDSEFEAYVRHRRGALVRTAVVLTAGDTHLAEDLVQRALVRLYVAWPRTRNHNLDAYVRRILVNGLIDEKRRPFARRERSVAQVPEQTTDAVYLDQLDPELLTALQALPVSMRTAVVLRHVEGMSVEETSLAMNCSIGNVKSQTSRGLDKLRDQLAEAAITPRDTGATT